MTTKKCKSIGGVSFEFQLWAKYSHFLALETFTNVLEWGIHFHERRGLWLDQVKKYTNDKVAAYLKVINRVSMNK